MKNKMRKKKRGIFIAFSLGLMASNTFAGSSVFSELSSTAIDTAKNEIASKEPVTEGDGNSVSLASGKEVITNYSSPSNEDSGFLALNTTATKGKSCTNGQIGMDSTGKILSCKSGVWTSSGDASDVAIMSANGQTRLPSGLIMKWGTFRVYLGGQKYVYATGSFPTRFPSTCYSAVLTSQSLTSGSTSEISGPQDIVTIRDCSVTSIRYRIDSNIGKNQYGYHYIKYIAIGR